MGRGDTRDVILRASAGEFVFDEDIAASDREAIREMWTNRLDGFHRLDLDRYLRDNTESTRYVIDGRTSSSTAYRRMCRVLFSLQRIGASVGVTLSAEALDPHTSWNGEHFVTRCCLVLMLGSRVVYQSRLTMIVALRGERFRWDRIIVERLPRRFWRYGRTRYGNGWEKFVVRERRRGACSAER